MFRTTALFLLFSTTVFASWKPFIGGGAGGDVNTPFQSFSLEESGSLSTTFAYSATLRAGAIHKDFKIHVGYHLEDSKFNDQYDHWYNYQFDDGNVAQYRVREDYRWDITWLELGARWQPGTEENRRVSPVIGGAITVVQTEYYKHESDWVKYGDDGIPHDYAHRVSFRTSKFDLGFIAEFGISIQASQGLSMEMMSRMHRYETGFDRLNTEQKSKHFLVISPIFEFGMTYLLPGF